MTPHPPGPAGSPGLPEPVAAVCATWLREVDARAPGLVRGLHLRGGVAFGEFVPGTSDVDFVAVVSTGSTAGGSVASASEVDALAAAHEATHEAHPDVPFDGIHVRAADLERDPDDCPDVPCALHGWWEPAGRYDVSPVAWHELATRGIPVRGELPVVWTDRERLLDFTRDHLATQWAEQADALAKFPAEAATDASTWCVLGVARLDHLLTTGEMTAKSAAGRWGLQHYGERWHRVVKEALRLRGATEADRAIAPQYTDVRERGADVAAFTAYVVETAG